MELPILDTKGTDTGEMITLNDALFNIEPNKHCVYLDVKRCRAHQRQGTHKTKERSEIRGSQKKLKKQKGTGTARVGNVKSPIRRGGGRAFGPRPRKYRLKINKKVKALARASVLSVKAKENNILVINDFNFEKPDTKQYIEIMQNLNVSDKKTLIIVPEITHQEDTYPYLSSRNIARTDVKPINNISTYHLLNTDTLIFVKGALEKLQ